MKHAWIIIHRRAHAILFRSIERESEVKTPRANAKAFFGVRVCVFFFHLICLYAQILYNVNAYNIKIVPIFAYDLSSSNAFESFFSMDFDYSRALFSHVFFFLLLHPFNTWAFCVTVLKRPKATNKFDQLTKQEVT